MGGNDDDGGGGGRRPPAPPVARGGRLRKGRVQRVHQRASETPLPLGGGDQRREPRGIGLLPHAGNRCQRGRATGA
eukprot:7992660-Pyramimonas_sp.AAC.1